MASANGQVETPVVLFIHSRPDHTKEVFKAIAAVRPRRLFVVADGPRPEVAGDRAACAAAIAQTEAITWPCEVSRETAAANLGCGERIRTGLDWVFDQVPEAIVLEDDCVPEPTFFSFCEELLDRYRDTDRVGMISGNCLPEGLQTRYSYDFSRLGQVWGWATWRSGWELYDPEMAAVPAVIGDELLGRVFKPQQRKLWETIFTYHDVEWDLQWLFARLVAGSLTVVPCHNLVSNIGHGPGATHTLKSGGEWDRVPSAPMRFPLEHPPHLLPAPALDDQLARRIMGRPWEPTLRGHVHDFVTHRWSLLRRALPWGERDTES